MAESTFGAKLGWSVGIIDWLDSKDNKANRYWRAIEYGSVASQTEIIGLWGNVPGVNTRPNKLHSGRLDAFGPGGTQKFAPFEKPRGANREGATQAALMYYFGVTGGNLKTAQGLDRLNIPEGENKRRDKKSGLMESRGSGDSPSDKRRVLFMLLQRAGRGETVPFVRGDVKKPIEAANYYRTTLRSKDWLARTAQQIGIEMGHDIETRSGFKAAQQEFAIDTRGDEKYAKPIPRKARYNYSDFGPTALASASASVRSQSFLQSTNGQFPPGQWQAILQDANAVVAREFQLDLVELMRGSGRRRVATDDFINSHDDDKNRFPRNVR
jgi:hypothetical protein